MAYTNTAYNNSDELLLPRREINEYPRKDTTKITTDQTGEFYGLCYAVGKPNLYGLIHVSIDSVMWKLTEIKFGFLRWLFQARLTSLRDHNRGVFLPFHNARSAPHLTI